MNSSTSSVGAGTERKLRQTIWLVVVGIVCLASIFGFFKWRFFAGHPWTVAEANTRYARSGIRADFPSIAIGDTLKRVYDVLGPPVNAIVDPDVAGDGSYRQYVDADLSLKHLLDVMTDTNKFVGLAYSVPRTGKLNYYLYFVNATNGVVSRLGGPIEMD